jgi:CubicO group peptidase (beta-lactamase class C family)
LHFLTRASPGHGQRQSVSNDHRRSSDHAHRTCRDGIGSDWRPIKTSWGAEFFKLPVVTSPGTNFVYTSAASFMLSAIIKRTTGDSMTNYLKSRLFKPLGIEGYQWTDGPEGITLGANGLSWKTVDSLKLGILHASGGK